MSARLIAVWVVVALSLAGPLQPLALAQQPRAETKADTALPVDAVGDNYLYDLGAAAITVVSLPLKGVVCVVGGVVGVSLLLLTLGSQPRLTAYWFEEGCGLNWIVTGNDIRPDQPGSRAFEYEAQRESR